MKYNVFTKTDKNINVMSKKLKILFLVLFASLSSYAQDPILFDTEWFLFELTVKGELIFIPDNGQIDDVTLDFVDVGLLYIVPCNSYNCETDNFSNTSFTIISAVVFDENCDLPATVLFEGIYIDGFFLLSTPNHIFDYVIEPGANNTLMLTITNEVGDVALYGNAQLGTHDFNISSVEIYPNPVKDILFISSTYNLKDFKGTVFDISGKQILSLNKTDLNNKAIDVVKLKSGIYFIMLEDEQGSAITKKFVKH